jgi:hypothetical protein
MSTKQSIKPKVSSVIQSAIIGNMARMGTMLASQRAAHYNSDQLNALVVSALTRIATNAGNFQDWETVNLRLFAGSIAIKDYFVNDPALNHCINQAVLAMKIARTRPHCGIAFGFTAAEHEGVTLALSYIDQALRLMQPQEIETAYQDAAVYLNSLVAYNKRCA